MSTAAQTFRVFVSSTFADLRAERDALQREVFPRLRELCTLGGARFQAIDLRWGVTEEAGLDQRTMAICLEEIDRCQRMTPKPNFVVLLGDRYGWRPLPREIPAGEHERVKTWAAEHGTSKDRERLARWYELDENAIDPVFFLRPRTEEFEDRTAWAGEERELHDLLMRTTDDLGPHERLRYTLSATEQEIVRGSPKAAGHMFSYLRQLQSSGGAPLASDLPAGDAAKDFLDLVETAAGFVLDETANDRIQELKERLRTDASNPHHDYTASWDGSGATMDRIGHLPSRLDACLDLLVDQPDAVDELIAMIRSKYTPADDAASEQKADGLCIDVWIDLASVILDEMASAATVKPLDREIDAHRRFGLERIAFADEAHAEEFFVGRSEVLGSIRRYLLAPDRKLLAVVGDPGSGKSSLLAKAVKDAREEGEKPPGAVIVERYIGATPESSDIRALLSSVAQEIANQYERPVPEANDYQGVVRELRRLLDEAPSAERPLWLVLDALDQLSSGQRAQELIWLPAAPPPHVAIVVSTLDGHDCHAALQAKRPEPQIESLGNLSKDEGTRLLRSWLARAGRNPKQFDRVIERFMASDGSPLYLKLAFEEARRWRSEEPAAHTDLSVGVDALIKNDVFTRLADKRRGHGSELVEGSLGLLAASRFGLAEDELLDLLSADTAVMAEFGASPSADKVDTLPVVVWSRLYLDLEPYLNERESEGVVVLGFFHRQLREAAENTYANVQTAPARHAALGTYFRRRSDPTGDGAWTGGYARGLGELPFHLTEAGEARSQELFDTLTDFTFLERKATDVGVEPHDDGTITYTGVYALQEDLERALEATGDGEDAGDGRRPLIITATDFRDGAGHMIRCPWCNTAFPFTEDWRGAERPCVSCRGPLKLNEFIVPEPAT